ncbi:MAG: cold shock domain-containing protein [Alistipes sp.]
MARPISFNKRELEKKKISKRLEKQQKKEERKSAGGDGSFENMIAYVDENGAITTTPPDLTKKKEVVDIDSIEVSTPKRGEMEAEAPSQGRIDHFNASKGYGFIKALQSGETYFFHVSSLSEEVIEGNLVTYELERGPRGMNAVNVKLVK